MEDFVEKLGWMKIAAIAGGLSLLMLIYVVISFLNMGSSQSGQVSNKGISPTPANDTNSSFNSNPNLPGKQTLSQKFTSGSMQVSYPVGFTASERSISGGGNAITFTNENTGQTIQIDVYDSSSLPITQIVNAFRALGYKETRTDNGDGITYKFSGSVGVGSSKIWEKAIVFSQNSKTYRILLTYKSATSDPGLEQTFEDMTSTLQLF